MRAINSKTFIYLSLAVSFFFVLTLFAGTFSPTNPTSTPTPYTLTDINNLIVNNSTSTGITHSVSTTSSPTTTSVSLSNIYANLGNLIQPENIKTGVTYLGITGNFGVSNPSRYTFSTTSSSLSPSSAPTATGYTLTDIYNLVTNNSTTTLANHSFTNSSPVATTSYSLSEIYNALSTLIQPGDVASGTTYLGVTGTYVASDPNLIAHYKMNDNAGNTTVVDTIGDYNGSASANTNTLSTTGKINGALALTTTGINLGNNSSINFSGPPFSYSAWVNIPAYDQYNSNIIGGSGSGGAEGNVGFNITNTGIMSFTKYGIDGAVNSTDIVPLNGWHLVIVTYNENYDVKFYIDGVIDSGGTQNFVRTFDHGNLYIGSIYVPNWGGWVINFNGLIDDVRIYNKALSQSEITALYNSGNGTEE